MADPESRDSGVLVPGFPRAAPVAPVSPVRLAAAPASAPPLSKIFSADQPNGADSLGVETPLAVVAELTAHKNAELPLCIGIFGGAGSGKSFALTRLAAAVEALTRLAKAQQTETPYLSSIEIVHADAAQLDGDTAIALTGQLSARLHRSAPALVEDAWRAVRDPHEAVREAAERLDQAQRRLHIERDSLNEVEGRRARLFDTLLYETPGSQVDAYARTHRPGIASRLQSFGFSGDPILSYKDLVASLATVQGPIGRSAMGLRALWAFKGQTRLLVYAFILLLIGSGLRWAIAHQDVWLTPFHTANATAASGAAWIEAHMDIAAAASKAAFAGAALAVAVNLWRAFRFLQPIVRGVTLLKTDLANRRHELDKAAAHQTRRVDSLAAEVEHAARLHADADQHVGGAAKQIRSLAPFQTTNGKSQAADFITAISALMAQKPSRAGAPQRIVVMLDNLDAVAPQRACEILDAAHRLLSLPGFVMAIAADPRRLAQAGHDVPAYLEKWVQVPVRIDAGVRDYAAFVTHLIGQSSGHAVAAPATMDARTSRLDQPLSAQEGQFLNELAPVAGPSARALKRFVNLYRLARPLIPEHWASLAFLLALDAGGRDAEMIAMRHALSTAKPGSDLSPSREHAQLADMLVALSRFEPGPVADALKKAAPIAARFTFKPH